MQLNEELGRPLNTKNVADLLGIDRRTVKKYFRELGGIELPDGRLLFPN